jgi:putative restriction endonuclease
MSKNWYHAAAILWNELADLAEKHQTTTYGQVAPLIDTNPLSVRLALDPIQRYCLDHQLPPMTALVVSQDTGRPGDGFYAWDVDDMATANPVIFAYPWKTLPNPFGGFGPADTPESLAHRLLSAPDSSADVYAQVKVRGTVQDVFRAALREAYDGQCAFCGLSFSQALEAAHIIPWEAANHAQRLDPRNGLLLCSTHHKLFDASLITVSRSGKIVYFDVAEKEGPYSAADHAMTTGLHGKPALLPENKSLRPSIEALNEHYQISGWLEERDVDLS